jgi:hypothetical protein
MFALSKKLTSQRFDPDPALSCRPATPLAFYNGPAVFATLTYAIKLRRTLLNLQFLQPTHIGTPQVSSAGVPGISHRGGPPPS